MAPTIARDRRRRTLPIAATTVVLMLTASCTDGGGGGEGAEATTVTSRHEWCEVLESLELPKDAPDVEPASAPMELQILLQFIAQNEAQLEEARESEGYPADVETAGSVEARSRIEAWGHEHCGFPDPFCSLWTSLDGIFAAGPTEAPLAFVVTTLDDELLLYAPDEHVDAVEDHLVALYASFGTPIPSDYREGDAEAARAELDDWVRRNC